MNVMMEADLDLPLKRGKVRDVYDLGDRPRVGVRRGAAQRDSRLERVLPPRRRIL